MPHVTLNIRITAAASTEGSTPELGHTYVVSASVSSVPKTILNDLINPDDPGNPNDPDKPDNPGKPAQAAFVISSDIEQRLHQILVDSALRGSEETAKRAKRLGIELFNYLFQPEIQTLYRNIKERAVQQRQPFVIRLRLQIAPAELSTLPWELLHDGEQYLCLSRNPRILFARVPDTIVKRRTLNYDPPLRLLGITASPDGQDKLDVEKEKEYIDTALQNLVEENRAVKEWKKAEENVLSRLKTGDTVHILHFIGHGKFSNQEGKIIFEDTRGRGVEIDAHRLSLALHTDTQLVFLNACDTARGDPQDYFSNFAYKLAVSRIPAIVAMQFKITDGAAIEFARTFYERVAAGEAIDEAVTEARHQIFVHTGALEWIAPVLYISSSSSVVFRSSRPPRLPILEPTPTDKPTRTRFSRLHLLAAVLAFLFLLGTLGAWLIHQSAFSPKTLCLATNLPENGKRAAEGRAIRHGVELALKQSSLFTATYNGYHLTEFVMDDSLGGGDSDPTRGANNLTSLPQKAACPNPIAVIGPYNSSVAQSEIPIAIKNHILLLSSSNTVPCLTQRDFSTPDCSYDQIDPQGLPNTYARLPGTDIDRGYLSANFLVNARSATDPGQGGLGASRIEIVADENIAQTAKVVMQVLEQKGMAPIGIDCIKPTNEYNKDHFCSQLDQSIEAFSMDNIAALATKIRDKHPDAVFFSGLNIEAAGLLLKNLRELGLNQVSFVGVGGVFVAEADTFFRTIGSHAANTYAIIAGADPSAFTGETAKTFSHQYQREFGTLPDPLSAGGYDAANIVIQAIKGLVDAGKPATKENVVQAVLSGNFTGVVGNNIHFDQYGDNIGQRVYTIYQSQQQAQDAWGWKVIGTRQTG